MVNSVISNIFILKICVVLSVFIQTTQGLNCSIPINKSNLECECENGTVYNQTTEICSSPSPNNCPDNSAGVYPDCKCTQNNFDYSVLINKCFRVCPEDSTGYWPNCTCSGEYGFHKENFECVKCATDTVSGIYPNCVCEDKNSHFNARVNFCETCPTESSGKIPNCTCNDGTEYIVKRNQCYKCLSGTTGVYPNCICDNGHRFNGVSCERCPWNSYEDHHGACICKGNGVYIKEKNWCRECPQNSVGVYPNCVCNDPLQFDEEHNYCFDCPVKSTGKYPNCLCENGLYGKANKACIECPNDSKGVFPNCKCNDEKTFSAYINQCYIECGANSTGLHPDCICNNEDDFYYDVDSKKCKSIIGRPCPEYSIGIGPDCLCINERHVFLLSLWECDSEYLGSVFMPDTNCPNRAQKWPQCDVSIDQKVLITLIG